MALTVHAIEASWADHHTTLKEIRHIVFVQEQNVPQAEEWDGQDETSTHFLAVNELGQYIGCARLLSSGQIGRMAVLKEYRGTGVGAILLEAAVEAAKQKGFDRVYLHAQSYAEAFYRKGGFVTYGREFMEAGIAHVAMEMKLPLAFESALTDESVAPDIRPQAPVNADMAASNPQSFHGLSDTIKRLDTVTESARRKLDLLHPTLDHELFDRNHFVQLISNLARSAPLVEVRILLMDSKLVVDRGHQLLELARRLDEKINIRLLNERITDETSSFVCVDQSGYWVVPNWREPQGICDLNNRIACARFVDTFNQAWEKSIADPQLRVLNL